MRVRDLMEKEVLTLRLISSGYIVTSLLWASALAAIVDRRLQAAGTFLLVAALCTLFGVIHSPLPGGSVFLPWQITAAELEMVIRLLAG